MRISVQVPSWVYWQMVNTAESESADVAELFYVACRAVIADFSAVEATALRKIITRLAGDGTSDPKIGKLLGIPPRRVRAIRVHFGIESQVRGRGKKKEFQELAT